MFVIQQSIGRIEEKKRQCGREGGRRGEKGGEWMGVRREEAGEEEEGNQRGAIY